jgi:hypothetical protein
MAKVQVLGQMCPHGGAMLIRGVFTQKKKLWAAMEEAAAPVDLGELLIVDDVSGRTAPASYGLLCDRLRVVGRAALVGPDGRREFQVVDAATNELRGWDVD